jgi:hypothetical protein
MWPFKPAKTREERMDETFKDLSDLVAYASMCHVPYRTYEIVKPILELYNEPKLKEDSEGKLKVKSLIEQFVFHCESDGWIKHRAYTEAKEFLEKTKL